MLNSYFNFSEKGTSLRTEVLAGITTFATMAYVIFVQPVVLGAAGMDAGAVFISGIVFVATASFGLRETIIAAVPESLKAAIAVGIGLLITLIGMEWAGIVRLDPNNVRFAWQSRSQARDRRYGRIGVDGNTTTASYVESFGRCGWRENGIGSIRDCGNVSDRIVLFTAGASYQRRLSDSGCHNNSRSAGCPNVHALSGDIAGLDRCWKLNDEVGTRR